MTREKLLRRCLRTTDRRSFLKACGVITVGAVAGAVLQSVFDVVRVGHHRFKVSQTRLQMGTYVTITAVHDSRAQAVEAIGRAFEEIDRLIGIFSRHDPVTPVSVLNRQGELSTPPPELVDLLQQSIRFHRLSGGAFDITVKPLLDLLEAITARDADTLPTRREIEAALSRVGCNNIEVGAKRVRFGKDGMGITLDGIAKGYIVDRASHTLSALGIDNYLINAGGDIRCRGTTSKRSPWRIAIQDPKKRGDYPDIIDLTSGAVATSGNYEVFFDGEGAFHHLIDPLTGSSPNHTTSVSVVADSVAHADALSTAVYVLGAGRGVRLVDGMAGVECLVVDEEGATHRSRSWRTYGGGLG